MHPADVVLIVLIVLLTLAILYAKNRNDKLKAAEGTVKRYEERFSDVLDKDAEIEKLSSEKQSIEAQTANLQQSYKDKRAIYDNLVRQAAIYNEEIELAELGFYKPHYDFDASEEYKAKIAEIKDRQKRLVRDKKAIYCTREWKVDGSRAKGRKMENQAMKLTARAFNNECDAAISRVRWNNANRLEERIIKAFDAINKMNEPQCIFIDREYLNMRLRELWLTHEHKEKQQQEREEQAEIRRRIQEEAKLEKEIANAAKEEENYESMLKKAQAAAEQAAGAKLARLQDRIVSLTEKLKEAHEKNERAKSMAQQTKAGHVYVLSNLGAFGEKVYKIGMTRRLDPLDRVRELGDASVPFRFDVHAMIFSDNAPEMESSLHRAFEDKRLNLVNTRREFFNTTLEEISQEVSKVAPDAEIILTAEAREYKESQAIQTQQANAVKPETEFPETI